ncbi:MAG: Uma2 family endonuclease [Bacteroidia bacterium]|nr:Uma2 family endonuclease [Bacteroidia bacterium]
MKASQKQYSVTDYMSLGEGDPHQLINGELVVCEPAPAYGHQIGVVDIVTQIRNYLKQNPVGEICCAPVDVYFDKNNVLQPDVVYISTKRKVIIKSDGIHGAPDIIIEIISPSSKIYDKEIKKEIYERFGVKEYWLVDYDDEKIIGYENVNGKFIEIFIGYGKFFSKLLNLEIKLKY